MTIETEVSALTRRKGLTEANGLLASVMKKLGIVPGMLAIKLPILGGIIYAWPYVSTPARWVVLAISAGIVINNLVQIHRARR